MKFEHTGVWGFEHAIRGMRNPKNSWDKSDSHCGMICDTCTKDKNVCRNCHVGNDGIGYNIGKNDLALMQKLIRAGSEHRKMLRQVFVSVDITAPLYWWKEFDTYKIGTVANSTSTMHKLSSTPITIDCFEMDDYSGVTTDNENFCFEVDSTWYELIDTLERLRQLYNKTKNKKLWKELIRLLPEGWLQTRTITMSYENIYNMVHQRKNHRLNEWSGIDNPNLPNFISWARTLPYAQELIFINENDNNKKEG